MLGPALMRLVTDGAFPVSLFGAVHLRNHIVQYRPLRLTDGCDVRIRLAGGRRRPQGLEFDVTQVSPPSHQLIMN